ncbi:type III pantothenate kinase [Marinilongibacter aquaticus]|uniref:type III pantothenate kinase n=1 Tax=Marinilongibacter aquaticus TaxID=2975157 RepID=UPI0021BD635D|nr:type III pantothenate kinase [Marinilongibacter aquaticus]UBM58512.1 type III pantothenate kinase [Marinilongibacter aquaticus]
MLVADIGNSDIVFGFFDQGKLLHEFRIPSKKDEGSLFFEYRLSNFILEHDIAQNLYSRAVCSSVVPELTPIVLSILEGLSEGKTHLVKVDSFPEVKVEIDRADELGTDLFCNAVAAYHEHRAACLIVDFGTALTMTAVNSQGQILGVSISPGLKTAVHSLFSKTAQLPEVPLEPPASVIGKNTVQAIQAGILIGYEGLVSHLIAQFKNEIDEPLKVFATGGLSRALKYETPLFDTIDRHLTLKGLYTIGEYQFGN